MSQQLDEVPSAPAAPAPRRSLGGFRVGVAGGVSRTAHGAPSRGTAMGTRDHSHTCVLAQTIQKENNCLRF